MRESTASTRASASSIRTGGWDSPSCSLGSRSASAKGKPFIVYEYGWDRTNYPTLAKFSGFLDTLLRTPEIAGDGFWALEAHNDGHGWMPIPANTSDPAAARHIETGQWWALYYPGIRTLVTTAADMSARAQAIRRHNYAMSGVRVPPHAIPPAPIVTSVRSGRVYWQGSAGAKDYSIAARSARRAGRGRPICRRCATDVGDGYADVGGRERRLVPRDPVQPRRRSAGPPRKRCIIAG